MLAEFGEAERIQHALLWDGYANCPQPQRLRIGSGAVKAQEPTDARPPASQTKSPNGLSSLQEPPHNPVACIWRRVREDKAAMSVAPAAIEKATLGLHPLEQYEPLIGAAAVERIARKADHARDAHIVHVSSTFYGGGVTEILTPLTLMMNALGIETGWHLIQGTPAFFNCTKKFHNALQGERIGFSDAESGDLRTSRVRERHQASSGGGRCRHRP